MNERTIIGLTGPGAGGKGTIADMLKEKGYVYFSVSDEIRKEARKRKWSDTDRKVLQNLGDELREKEGPDVWATRVAKLNEFKHADLIVIDSIRHPAEISYFKEFFDAKIIGVTASPENLFERMRMRDREGDPKTLEDFLQMLKRENGEKGSTSMQVDECLRLADALMWNNGTKDDLEFEIARHLSELKVDGLSGGQEMRHH